VGADGDASDAKVPLADASSADASTDSGVANQSLRAQVCGLRTTWPDPLPPRDQRTAQRVGNDTFGFIEGPVWIAELGVLLFSDMALSGVLAVPPAQIRRLRPPASFDVFVGASGSNGLALGASGQILAATHDTQSLSLFALGDGARTNIPVLSDGKHFNSPNDLTVTDTGSVFFTDPDYQLGDRVSETMRQGVYKVPGPLSTTSNSASLVDGTLDRPNGIALSPDQRTLYVGSSAKEIWKYELTDGVVGARSKFAETGGSDGMTVDCAGNLYVTSGTVEVFAPSGTPLGELQLGGSPSNVAFGGADRKTLYITAGSRLYSIELNVPGFPY